MSDSCHLKDRSPPAFSAHAISQARMLKWVALSASTGSSGPGTEPKSPALAGGLLTTEPPGKQKNLSQMMWEASSGVLLYHCYRSGWKQDKVKYHLGTGTFMSIESIEEINKRSGNIFV